MIQPERFSDSHEIFKHFRDVTSPRHFLKANKIEFYPWPTLILFLITWAALIWFVHSFVPLFVLRMWTVPYDQGLWLASTAFGMPLIAAVLFVFAVIVSGRTKKALKKRNIKGGTGFDWFGPEVQQLTLQEFTRYLMHKGLYNLEALKQLIESARDEIDARWRAITVVVTVVLALLTLCVAFILGVGQPMFSESLTVHHPSDEEMWRTFTASIIIVVGLAIDGYILYLVLKQDWKLFTIRNLDPRMDRAIYIHCLSNIRLSLLKRPTKESIEPEQAIASPPAQTPNPASFSFYCEFRHPFRKESRFILAGLRHSRP